MRQMPFRPGNEISQSYNSGVVTVYRVTDGARPGFAPAPVLEKKAVLRYEEQRLGLTRLYLSRQNQVRVEKVIRVPRGPEVSSRDVAVTEDGRQYRIDAVQLADRVRPPSLDLTLTKAEQVYDVSKSDTEEGGSA
ncbi:MAG: hypothetical protein HFF17_15425 [Oscillospiraceae bacterium]|nr:hypothetical protein [Oscillospiraceae bacterium]MCI9165624.1 hypothetical protein [Oscillospiraceae bacterium]